MVQYTEWRSISDGSIISSIPDSGHLHARYDFSEEDGSTPVTDQSGNGRDLLNGNYSGVGVDINGVQAGLFDGTDDSVWSDTFAETLEQPFTIAWVVELDNSPNSLNTVVSHSTDATDKHILHRDDNDEIALLYGTSDLAGGSQFDMLGSALIDGANSILRVEGSQVATGDPGNRDADLHEIGAQGQGNERFFDGKMGEILIYEDDRSESFDEIESYLADKWGVSI